MKEEKERNKWVNARVLPRMGLLCMVEHTNMFLERFER